MLAASFFLGAALVTIGSPRGGDQVFADHVLATVAALKRYVDCSDVITTLPPPVTGVLRPLQCEIYIDRDGTISPAPGETERAVDQVRVDADYVLRCAVKQGNTPTPFHEFSTWIAACFSTFLSAHRWRPSCVRRSTLPGICRSPRYS
jgi:hypothetical protein